MKELQSFFDNSVWQFDQGQGVPDDRILKAKFILGWKKNPDGSPRAKARLVVQGFRDPEWIFVNDEPYIDQTVKGIDPYSGNYAGHGAVHQ